MHKRKKKKKRNRYRNRYRLKSAYQSCPRNEIKINLRDFNVRIGREIQYLEEIGKQGLHTESNDDGTRLTNLATLLNKIIVSTCFDRKDV